MTLKKEFGREKYLDLNSSSALIGQLGVGVSWILRKSASVHGHKYIDLSRVAMTPEEFAVSYVSCISSKRFEDSKFDVSTGEIVAKIKNELSKVKPDHKFLVELALNYGEEYFKERKTKAIVILDEFWRFLDLNNFDMIKDSVSLFKKIVSSHSSVSYVIGGNAVYLMKEIALKLGYSVVNVSGVGLKELKDDELLYYSTGVPLFANAITSLDVEEYSTKEKFLVSCLVKDQVIYSYCKYKLEESLSRARGKSLLISILKVLCKSNGLRLNEISRAIFRTSSVAKNLVTRLIEVDLIVRSDNVYHFSDPVLKFWFMNYVNLSDYDFVPSRKELEKIDVNL